MSAFPPSSAYLASASSDTAHVFAEQDTALTSRGSAGAAHANGMGDEEAILFDIVLPRAAPVRDSSAALRSCHEKTEGVTPSSTFHQEMSDVGTGGLNEAVGGSCAVGAVNTEEADDIKEKVEAALRREHDGVYRQEDGEAGEELQQQGTHIPDEKYTGKQEGLAVTASADVSAETGRTTLLQTTNRQRLKERGFETCREASSSPLPAARVATMVFDTQSPQEVGNDNAEYPSCKGEAVPVTGSSPGRIGVADSEEVDTSGGPGAGGDPAEGGDDVCLKWEGATHTDTDVTGGGKKGASKNFTTVRQLKPLTPPLRTPEVADAGEQQPSETSTFPEEQRCVRRELGRPDGTVSSASPRAAASQGETCDDDACGPPVENGVPPELDSSLTPETDPCRSRVREKDSTVVQAHSRSGSGFRRSTRTPQSDGSPILSVRLDDTVNAQKSFPLAGVSKIKCERGAILPANLRTSGDEQRTLGFQEGAPSLVSSRRQLFERKPHADTSPQSPSTPLVSKKHAVEQVGKVSAVRAEAGSRRKDSASRRESAVERLREKYERGTSGGCVASTRARMPASQPAVTMTSTGVDESKPEPTWSRKQRGKVQVAREAAGQARVMSAEAAESSTEKDPTSGAARHGARRKFDFAAAAALSGPLEGPAPSRDVDVMMGSNSLHKACKCNDSLDDICNRVPRRVVSVCDGECVTVTSLKAKFEGRKTSLTEGWQQQSQQSQQPKLQQQQQTLRQPAEGVKLLKAQYERRTSRGENKGSRPCEAGATTVPTHTKARLPPSLSKQEGSHEEYSTSSRNGDSGTDGTTARSTVKCLKEQYQRLVTAAHTPSPRAAGPVTFVTSTSIKDARERLGSVDIVGRYGKPYWIAKAEGALRKDESHTGAETLDDIASDRESYSSAEGVAPAAVSAVRKQASDDRRSVRAPSRDNLHSLHSGEITGGGRQTAGTQEESVSGDVAPGRSRAQEGESEPTGRHVTADPWKTKKPTKAPSTELKSTFGERITTGRCGPEKALCVGPAKLATGASEDEVTHSGGGHLTLHGHASSKIGALASALGPACINFGKAPPRRLLTRPEPEVGAEDTDLEIYGYSKAQEAIERRKREMKLLATTSNSSSTEREDLRCAKSATEGTHSTLADVGVSHCTRVIEDQVDESRSRESEGSCRAREEHDKECRRRGNEAKVDTNDDTRLDLSSDGSSGETRDARWGSATGVASSGYVGKAPESRGTEEQQCRFRTVDAFCSSGSRRLITASSGGKAHGVNPWNSHEVTSGERTASREESCRQGKTADLDGKAVFSARCDKEAQNGASREVHENTTHIAVRYNQSSGGCLAPVQARGSTRVLESNKTSSRHRLRVNHAQEETNEVFRSAEDKLETQGRGPPSVIADRAMPGDGDSADTEAHEETSRRQSSGQLRSFGFEAGAADDEGQSGQVKHGPIARRKATAPAEALAEADQADIKREEQVDTVSEGPADAPGRERLCDVSSPGEKMERLRSAAHDVRKGDELGWAHNEASEEGGVMDERMLVGETLPTAEEGSGASAVGKRKGGCTGATIPRGSPDEKLEEAGMKVTALEEVYKVVADENLGYTGVHDGSTYGPGVKEGAEARYANADGDPISVTLRPNSLGIKEPLPGEASYSEAARAQVGACIHCD